MIESEILESPMQIYAAIDKRVFETNTFSKITKVSIAVKEKSQSTDDLLARKSFG